MSEFQTFEAFWPFYLKEHSSPLNRRLHFVGTSGALFSVFLALATQQWTYLLLAPLCGYSFAWVGHFVVEKNRPATFRHPLWSLRGDFRMFAMICMGKLDSERQRLGV